MILWLDHLIYGSGKGMKSPFWDSHFYWLVDKNTKRGELYTWKGWFGAQLMSIQWTHPNAGERRILGGYEFKPLHSYRRWGRVEISWSICSRPLDHDEFNLFLRFLKSKLGE